MAPQQPHRDGAANAGAQRVARGLQRDGQAAPALRGVFAGDHVAAGQDAAHAQAREHAQRRQLRGALAEGRAQHAHAREGQAGQDQRPAAQPVGPGRDQQRSARHAEQACTEQKAQLGAAELPVRRHGRGRERHDQDVEAVDHVEHHAQGYDRPLEARHGPLVDACTQVGAHGRSSRNGQLDDAAAQGRCSHGTGVEAVIVGLLGLKLCGSFLVFSTHHYVC